MSEARLKLTFAAPAQVPFPDALVVIRLTMQVLVFVLLGFGTGRGGPKRHPGFPGYSGLTTPAEEQKRFSCPPGTPGWPATSAVPVAAMVNAPAAQAVMLLNWTPMSGTTDG